MNKSRSEAGSIVLVYDRDCPNVERARAAIVAALHEVGAPSIWTEWDREGENTPTELRRYGSPTVLVDGHDVGSDDDSAARADANSCRVYRDETGTMSGIPSTRMIVSAISRRRATKTGKTR